MLPKSCGKPKSQLLAVSNWAAQINLDQLRSWKNSILEKKGRIKGLAQKRGVQMIHGRGHFEDLQTLRVETSEGQKFIRYEKAIIAVGSKPAMPSAFDLGNKRIMTSTEALRLKMVPRDLLVVGGGYWHGTRNSLCRAWQQCCRA